MAAFRAIGIITLTTDFGAREPFVGIMKGVMLGHAPHLRFIDMAHEVSAFQPVEAGFWLAHALRYFPAGTLHVAVVDPGVGSNRRILVAVDRGSAYLAPDNTLLEHVLSSAARVRALDVERFALPNKSRTFHGRDVFAPAAAAIAEGLDPLAAGVGDEFALACSDTPRARIGADHGEAEILFADHFGNLVLSARGEDLAPTPADWIVEVAGLEVAIRGTYADAPEGALLGLIDSFGAVEIALRGGDAAAQLGLGSGDRVTLRRIR
jgi:S-adenosylmethionine hydrolase